MNQYVIGAIVVVAILVFYPGCAHTGALTDSAGNVVYDKTGNPVLVKIPPTAQEIAADIQLGETLLKAGEDAFQSVLAIKDTMDNTAFLRAQQAHDAQAARIQGILTALKTGQTTPAEAKSALLSAKKGN